MKKVISIILSLLFSFPANAQLKLGSNLTTIDVNSLLELESSTKLLVLSSAGLTSTTNRSPYSPTLKTGALVFNTNASISAGSSSYPVAEGGIGLYLWDGSGWKSLQWSMADADLLSRSNHTGTQTASTISDFSAAVAATAAVMANTAKVTNATHTGDVTGSEALTYNNVVPSTKGGAGTVSGLLKANGSGIVSAAVAGTDYLTPTGSASGLTDFPTLNQSTTGTAGNVSGTVAIGNGGTGATTAATARTNLGATTVGGNLFTLTNPTAITFPRFNADNTVSTLDAASFRTAIGAGTSSAIGTVTSVGGSGTVSGLTLSGTVTTSGNLSLGGTLSVLPSNFASQTANTILAAPNGSAGVPTFRALVAADVPTLNQNTTGTAGNVTGTVAIGNGGTGATTAATARTNLGATTVGGNLFTLTNPTAITFPRFNADNTVSTLDAATFRTAIGAGTSSTTGTVTSVAMSVPSFLSVSGSPVTTTGTLSVSYSGTALPTANGGTGSTTGAGLVSGGTSGYIPKYTASNTVGTGLMYDNGSNVLVGTTSASLSGIFQINGGIAINNLFRIDKASSASGVYFVFSQALSNRWNLYPAADATSDLTLSYYNDAGTYVGDTYTVTRSTGRFKFVAPFVAPSAGSAPSSPVNGTVYYDTRTHKLRVYANSTWVDLH